MVYPELFLRCLMVILHNEGGYSNNPHDPGHATMKKGITQVVYDGYNHDSGHGSHPVIDITDEEVNYIYYTKYWLPMKLDSVNNDELVLDVFDMGVNSGIRMSIKILQRLIGVKDDGFIGPQTLRAIREFNGDIVAEFKKRRKLFYVTLVQAKEELRPFAKGWIKRVDATHF